MRPGPDSSRLVSPGPGQAKPFQQLQPLLGAGKKFAPGAATSSVRLRMLPGRLGASPPWAHVTGPPPDRPASPTPLHPFPGPAGRPRTCFATASQGAFPLYAPGAMETVRSAHPPARPRKSRGPHLLESPPRTPEANTTQPHERPHALRPGTDAPRARARNFARSGIPWVPGCGENPDLLAPPTSKRWLISGF